MRRVEILIAAAVLFSSLWAATSTAQAQTRPERKVINKIAPFYPEIAKHMRLGGMVKLEVVVLANGRVKSVKVLGGSPALIQPAIVAVEKWRFEASSEETTEVVLVLFSVT